MEERRNHNDRKPQDEFVEKLVKLTRTSVTKKGGRKMSFSALTVVGDQKGRIGYGFGKANDVTEAIRKSIDKAKSNLVTLPMKNGTLPHEVIGTYNSSSVLLKPACPGTGVKAGGPVRAVMDAAGITDVISKSQGSRTSVNVIRATFDAVSKMMNAGNVAENRGKSLNDLWG
ncbi:MAG: 30S ribosomal protein S5 [Treponema sp.]|jgi:small subunit ribosomal protein S5|nr:30S ribosomal protein S5 [Treponema sp.]